MPDILKNAIASLLSEPALNAIVQKSARHLSRVSLYNLTSFDALQPELKIACIALIGRMNVLSKPVYLKEGFRTAKRQDELYAQGRTLPGGIITNAKGLQSYHNYGLAFDLVFKDYEYNPPADWWDTLGREGRALGLEWGGGWIDFKDRPHFELPGLDWKLLEKYFKQ